MKRLLVLILICFAKLLWAQEVKTNFSGNIELVRDSKIDSLLKRYRSLNEQKRTINGFRVQIYTGTQRIKANEIKVSFVQKYSNVNAYLQYQQPNFKIRVGDFRTRLEAYRLYKQLLLEYDAIFIVKDEVRLPKE